jgi:leucyl aminopeptidase (aminopeptidase T)
MATFPPLSDPALSRAAEITVTRSLGVRPGERVLIITNPEADVTEISHALYHEVKKAGGIPNLIWQETKSQLDPMDEAVRGALLSEPDIYISMSANKIGKDLKGVAHPYTAPDGTKFDSISGYLIHGKKCTRGFWSPGITKSLYCTSVPADFEALKADCAWLAERLSRAVAVRITSPGGTELTFSTRGRTAFIDDGDYRRAGTGGNLPAGESYISPVVGTAEGRIVFDGSMSTHRGTIFLYRPITVEYEKGFITQIAGGEEAEALAETIRLGEENAVQLEAEGKLGIGKGQVYARNARSLGELGIGVNPLAGITGNMIVDEKAARTCHFAVGSNYDQDGPALIHLDGLVKEPTIELELENGSNLVLVEDGELIKRV